MGDHRSDAPVVAHRNLSRRDLLRVGGLALLPGTASFQAAETSPGEMAPFDNLMSGFLKLTGVPGASLAVAHEGRLVYARGFGRLDQDRVDLVGVDTLFRIASISKPITATAVFRLIDDGKLRLDDRIFDVLNLGAEVPEGKKLDHRWREITIFQLLRHQGGWDRTKGFDPMVQMGRRAWDAGPDPSKAAWSIIRAMLGRKINFVPGTRYVYSNFGYALLGRAVEKVTGRSYDAYVRETILAPAGAYGMRLGKTLLADRVPGEVRYHDGDQTAPAACGPDRDKPTPLPYGVWCLEAMDSHGGWLASATDLVRFASAVDDRAERPLLSASSLRAMVSRPLGVAGYDKEGEPLPVYYGCGWQVRKNVRTGRFTRWHAGGLDGTSSLLVSRHDGIVFAALFNARATAEGNELSTTIDPLLNKAIARIRDWPEGEPLIRAGTA